MIFPIQTVVVHNSNPDDIEPVYFVLNAAILGVGLGLNHFPRRPSPSSPAAPSTQTVN